MIVYKADYRQDYMYIFRMFGNTSCSYLTLHVITPLQWREMCILILFFLLCIFYRVQFVFIILRLLFVSALRATHPVTPASKL